MAKLISDVLTEARVILNDNAGDRYTTTELIASLNSAISQTKAIRPDLFIFGEALPQFTISDLAVDFPLPDIVFQSFVYYLAGNAELRDDEFAVDNRAMTLIGAYRQQLTS